MVFDARIYVALLQQCNEVSSVDLAVTEDCGQEAWACGLTRVDGYNRSAAVGVTKEGMAALDSGAVESDPPQGGDHLSPVIRGRRLTPR